MTLKIEAIPSHPESHGQPSQASLEDLPEDAIVRGQMEVVPPVMGRLEIAEKERQKGFSISSGGRALAISFGKQEQKRRYEELEGRLIGYYRNHAHHSNIAINLTRGYLEVNGEPLEQDGKIFYLNEDPDSDSMRDLQQMRQLYHEVMGQRYSDSLWRDPAPHDRACRLDPLPFQKRKESDALKRAMFTAEEVPPAKLKEYHMMNRMRERLVHFLDNHHDQISGKISTWTESRKQQIHKAKETLQNLDELVSGYHAAYSPPDLSGKNRNEQQKALQEYRSQIRSYLNESVKKHTPTLQNPLHKESKEQIDQAIEEIAKEMALLACQTRSEYQYGCIAFETKPCRTTPEMFLMRLSALVANPLTTQPAIAEWLERNVPLAFRGLSHEEDRQAIGNYLRTTLIPQIRMDFEDPVLLQAGNESAKAFHQRLEQLDSAKKQKEIAVQQSQAIEQLQAAIGVDSPIRPIADQFRLLADEQQQLAEQIQAATTNEYIYTPFGNRIVGGEGIKVENSLVKRIENQITALEAQAKTTEGALQKTVFEVINQLQEVLQRQIDFGTFCIEKAKKSWNPFHKKPALANI